MNSSRIEFFEKRFQEDKAIERSRIEETENNRVNKFNANGLWSLNNSLAIGEILFNENYNQAKQRFYNCGLIAEYLNKRYEHPWLGHGQLYMLYGVMSDHSEIIERLARLTHPSQQKVFNKNAGVISTCIQCIIRGDSDQLNKHINFLKVLATRKKPKLKFPGLYAELFEAFVKQDNNQIEHLLVSEFEGAKFKRSMKAEFTHEHLISLVTLGYAKLANYKKLVVNIDKELVPKQMIPFESLDSYNIPYWFLKKK